MDIKPMYDNTIKMSVTNIKLESTKIDSKRKDNTIPNGIYGVIRWEKIRQLFTIILNLAFLLIASTLMILYSTTMTVSWFAYVIPILISLLSLWKMLITLFERSRILKDISRYKEDLNIGLESTPPFISRLYMQLHQKQVSHNWFTIFILFYGGIATILLWWLKDISWWIFDFSSWIQDMFSSPITMAWLFTSLLIGVSLLHIIFAIQRKKRILDINSYFGGSIATSTDIETMKQSRNKMYRRLFIISIMIILIIPIVARFVLKFIKRK